MSYRSSASFGKRQEFIAIAELLSRDHDVYLPLVDDQQIDCVIRQEKSGKLRHVDIQIKARSKQCIYKNGAFFAGMDIRNPRKDYYFIFYSEHHSNYWVVPSLELTKVAVRNKTGKHAGTYSINFCRMDKGVLATHKRFEKYEKAFELLL